MYGINEIKKLNVAKAATTAAAQAATYCVLRNNDVLLRNGNKTQVLETGEASNFLQRVRNRNANQVKSLIQEVFAGELVLA